MSTPRYAGMFYRNQVKIIYLPSGEAFESWEAALAHERWLAEWDSKWGDG
jgi:hypothetical protein